MTEQLPHLLLVDDERQIRDPLQTYLERNSLRVTSAPNAANARRLLASQSFDLAILDVMMAGEDGLSLCRHISEAYELPIIFLTAVTGEADRIVGLEIGADDYVLKPFNPRELLARCKAVLRRANAIPRRAQPPSARTFSFGDWKLDCVRRELEGKDGVAVPLSTGEYNLLLAFLQRPQLTLTRDQLLDITQNRAAAPFERSIDNQISRLRRKIEGAPGAPSYIKTVWGGGYVFCVDVISHGGG